MLLNRAIYELVNGKNGRIKKKYLRKLKHDFPEYELPPDLQKLLINK